MPLLTLVTAAHRNPSGLRAIHAELADVLDADLRWWIQDSAACPETRDWASQLEHPGITFRSEPDDGIYDALNRALDGLRTPFYLVVGSDDSVNRAALRAIVAELAALPSPGPDILTFPVSIGGRVCRRQRWWPRQVNVLALTASHSVGTVIRRDLHTVLGPYDTRYRILADSLFLRRAQLAARVFDHRDDPVPGRFATTGVSHRDHGRLMIENFSYNVECGSSAALQGLMFVARLLAYRPRSLL